MTEKSLVERVSQEIKVELSNESVSRALIATTFKGLTQVLMKQALMEGMLRGFSFQEFMQRDVYALPFNGKGGATYSIVTSIDFARKIASRTGQYFGKSAPKFEVNEEQGQIISCEITVKKLINGQCGEFSALVYFNEYDGKRNLWLSKPRTMIAKVAEMHALRMAFPEEMAKLYVEEEFDKPSRISAVVEHIEDGGLTMGKYDTTKDQGEIGEGIDPETPDTETIIQIEEATNS